MVLWCRIRHSRIECLSHQCKRWYFQIPGVSSANYIAGRTKIRVFDKPNSFDCPKSGDFHGAFRFFSVAVQAKPKPETKDSNAPRLNDQITSEFIRLVSDEGHRVVSRREALDRARELKLDLVEVQRHAKPPVCKIMDFHREKYKKELKEKDRAKSKAGMTPRKGSGKEVRFSGKTEQKDLQMKADMIKRLMEKGYRVKCMATGTEDQDLGGLLSRLSALIEDVSVIESGPWVEKRQAYVIVRHSKFGPTKKGGSKVAKVAKPTSDKIQQATTSPTLNSVSPIQSPLQIEEDWELSESGSESEDDNIADQMPVEELGGNKSTWSVIDASDDFGKVFDLDDGGKQITSKSTVTDLANAGLAYLKPQLRSAETNSVPALAQESKHEIENRYSRRSESRSTFQPTKSVERTSDDAKLFDDVSKFSSSIHRSHVNNVSDSKDSVPLGSQAPNLGRNPQKDVNASPSTEQQKRLGTDVSSFRNLKQSPTDTPSSPPPSYGIFSAPKPSVPSKQTEANKEKERNSLNSTHSPNARPSKPRAENSQRPEFNKTKQGGWGIFSEDVSRNQNRNSDIQAKVQR